MSILPLFIAIPLAAAFLAPLGEKRFRSSPQAAACAAALALALLSVFGAYEVLRHGNLLYRPGGWPAPLGISVAMDALSAFVLVTVNTAAFLIAVYSTAYTRKFTDTWKFYSLYMFMVGGINGVLVAGDIFTLYVFLEMAALAGYFLVAFGTTAEELEASFKYAVMGTVASIFILLGIGFLYSSTSTLNMADMSRAITSAGGSDLLLFVSVLFLMGFGLKAALAPFHSWLAYAHSAAPAPVSAMLSGVSIKVLGIYALARIFYNVLGMTAAVSGSLIALAVASMVVGAVLAFGQRDLKRLFAYSSVSQIGYIALGLGVGTPLAILGSLFYLLNHSAAKALLFLNSGSAEGLVGTRDLGRIRDLAAVSPATGYTMLAGALSISGVPPFGGFWAKAIIIFACVASGHPWLALVTAIVSVLTLGYYFRALTPVLFGPAAEPQETGRIGRAEAAAFVALALVVTASVLVLLPSGANELLRAAASVLSDGAGYARAFTEAVR
jgi:multicomponent Na+:H+ antiporter subunit D